MRGIWHVVFVHPRSEMLVDRTGELKIATTDPNTRCIYLSNALEGDILNRVLIHELSHCIMISYDLISDIRRFVYPEYWIEAEEWVCNFIANYGIQIYSKAYDILGDKAWLVVPRELERLFN